MSTLAIVEHLDVVEDGVREFEPRAPLLSVEQFVLHARPERLHHGVIERSADGPEGRHEPRVTNSLGEAPGREVNSVVRMNDGSPLGSALLFGHVERVNDEGGVLTRVDRPADVSSAARVEDAATEDFSFSRSVLRDVRDPQLVERRAIERALDYVVRRRGTFDPLDLARSRNSGDSRVVHENRDETATNVDAATLSQFGVHPSCSISAAAHRVDLANTSGEPLTTNHRRRHRTVLGQVVAGTGHAQHPAARFHFEPGVDEGVDHRVDPLGRTTSLPSNS